MFTGQLPPTSIHGTWTDNIEVFSIEDDTPYNFDDITEIMLKVRDPRSRFDELILRLSTGEIVIPDDGVIQWRAEASQMGTLEPKLYEVILLLEDATDTVPLILGSISIVE